VIFDAGLLLSYSAVISIICFLPYFYNKLNPRTWIGDKIWKSAAVTIVAQAGTLALTVSLFNRFPVWFILTNVIIVPMSSALIISGCLIPLTYPIKFISHPLAVFLNHLTWLTENLTEKAAGLPLSTIENIGMRNIESFLFYVVIFLILLFFTNRKELPLLYPFLALMIFLLVCTMRSISDKTSCELIVYNGITSSPVGIRTGRILNLYTETGTILPEVSRHCATRGLKTKPVKMVSPMQMLQAGNKKILISSNLTDNVLQETRPDIIILRGNNPRIDSMIELTNKIEAIICTSDVSTGFRLNINSNRNRPDTIHYVRYSGAFRTKL
jgi:competence protein ComEC